PQAGEPVLHPHDLSGLQGTRQESGAVLVTRLLLTTEVPGAVRPAKNCTAPGLPNHTTTASKGRTLMVDTSTSPAAEPSTGDELTFTPAELNTLISRACAETVAARLRERAAWHRQQADRGRGSG